MPKITALTAANVVANSDLIVITANTGGTPVTRSLNVASLATALDAATPKSDAIKMNIDDVRTFSDAGITLVVPPEDSFFTTNYYPEPFFTAGCQFIFKNYQNNDKFMEPYITKFNSSSFVDK